MRLVLIFWLCASTVTVFSQSGSFDPQADTPGTLAIHKDSNIIRDWALSCEVSRGYRQYNLPDSGLASSGTSVYATGKADAPLTISLGDGGYAILTFTESFYDGPGYDLVVFENAFGAFEDSFLEFAIVSVSSNGIDFFDFPSTSEISTLSQKGTFDNTDASLVNNLAGKYHANFGVGFDLADVIDTSSLDKQRVTHVRVTDVIGVLDSLDGTLDANGTIINDPWPTLFDQSGFDLDAVGIIHSNLPLYIDPIQRQQEFGIPTNCYDLLGNKVDCNAFNQAPIIMIDEHGQRMINYHAW